ncbi:hypothetical protein JXC34_03570 [Candidatus Woesearchaeota archaeon]|nr:hypothetical protein [Candidatus Woesearchaeota archaeon]
MMAFMTPFESALEAGLEMIGMPFEGRSLIYASSVDAYLQRQSTSESSIDQVADPRLREIFRAKRKEGVDWGAQLVYRTTVSNKGHLFVQYAIHPSDDNSRELSAIRDYAQFEKVLDRILRERSFHTEEVYVMPDLKYRPDGTPTLTQEDVDAMRDEIHTNPNVMPSREEWQELIREVEEDDIDDRGLYIGFHPNEIEANRAPDVPEDIFVGINSPVVDAERLAFRICLYLAQSE